MISGWFDPESGRPVVKLRFALRGQLVDDEVHFLVDTGADVTIISGADAAALDIDHDALDRIDLMQGLGGDSGVYAADAVVVFEDPDRGACVFNIEAGVLRAEPGVYDPPSLLGRDVLDRVRLIYDRVDGDLLLDLKAPDAVI